MRVFNADEGIILAYRFDLKYLGQLAEIDAGLRQLIDTYYSGEEP
jgi:hypothetical protein